MKNDMKMIDYIKLKSVDTILNKRGKNINVFLFRRALNIIYVLFKHYFLGEGRGVVAKNSKKGIKKYPKL